MITTCDGERIYFIYSKEEFTREEAIQDAKRIIGDNIIFSYAKEFDYGQFLVMEKQGEYYCITKE